MRLFIVTLLCIPLFAAQVWIDFQGNQTFDKERLFHELGFEKSLSQKLLFKKLRPKVEARLLPSLLEELKLFYQEQGFFDVSIDTKFQNDSVIFMIDENEPIKIAAISVTSDFPIKHLIPFHTGDRFIVPAFVQMKKDIKKALLQKGYCSYELNAKAYIYKKNRIAYIVLYLKKGQICDIGSIQIQSTIPKKVVQDHIFFKPGQPFSLERVDESYKELYSLGYFRSILIDYSKKIDNHILLDINLKERKKKNIYKAGIGFETDRGALINLFYKNTNFHLHQPSITLTYSDIKKELSFQDFYPSITLFDNDYDITNRLSLAKDRYDTFQTDSVQINSKLIKKNFFSSYSFGLTLRKERVTSTQSCIGNGYYTLLYPSITFFLDRRDSKIDPTKGWFLSLKAQSSLKAFSNSNFLKTETTFGWYYPLESVQLYAKAKFGQLLIANGNLPPSIYFYAGGSSSNRAYSYRSIHALDSSCDIGGKSLLQTTVEFRKPVFKNVLGALFWDRVYLSRKSFTIDRYVDGVGLGAIYPTPIGNIKAYFGIDPKNISQNSFFILIGESF
ncbi:autotransporter assembly complex protein TamA [Nitratiruptor sp. SB155-2]|uniref:autotransporter assembly complex protein TamA n=1 Tax=Nitratiruptor sp. (strain SB155-2) TaxID=387092 RepID=UPI0001586D16|nr:BamA/TamA family outer membrane protein [Nitratiruptor sp. SB155-2]BAF69315.1 conserved hypothetical protein [Nitratiruptor sp. SB155-2]